MDERRALVAMLLIFLVYIVFTMMMPQQQRPTRLPEEAPQKEVIEEPDTSAVEAVVIGAVAEEASMKEAVVVTRLYTCRFSSLGGGVTSFKLRDYLQDEGVPVELVPESDRLPFGVALLLSTGDRLDLSGVNWKVSRESLNVEGNSEASLLFELTTEGGLSVRKACRFNGDTYAIGVEIEVAGPGSDMVRAVEFGWQSGLSVTETHRETDDLGNFRGLTLTSEEFPKVKIKDLEKREEIEVAGDIRWAGLKTKYFLAAIVPSDTTHAIANFFSMGEKAIGMALETDRSGPGPQEFMVYAGPLDYRGLKALGLGLEKAVDFGWSWISPLSRLMFRFMVFCHGAIPNYGLVIIILSTLIKVLFYPLTQKSMKSMKAMQQIQPEIERLRKDPKYKDKPQELQKAIMKTYSERGVNPMGGCFPMLLQMPVFIALFQVLSRTIELRRAPFVLWIKDLSAPDVVARLPFSLPFIGDAVSLLPILMGVAMFVQQKMQTTDPKQAAMTYMLPVVFTVLFFRFPSGLVLYWLVNNVLTIGHHYLMDRADRRREVLTTGG
jgi:YidC/Oxa1 family membrane protein insertase